MSNEGNKRVRHYLVFWYLCNGSGGMLGHTSISTDLPTGSRLLKHFCAGIREAIGTPYPIEITNYIETEEP
jgi:hypothetical protein